MSDLTKITTPFGLLDATTLRRLVEHEAKGGKLEYYASTGKWVDLRMPAMFASNYVYRAAPLPPVTADELAKALRNLVQDYEEETYMKLSEIRSLLARYDEEKKGK